MSLETTPLIRHHQAWAELDASLGRSDRGLNERAPFIGTDRFLKKLAVELRSLTWPRLHLFGVSSAPSSSNGLSAESFDQICTKGWEDALFAMRAYEFAAKAIGELAYRPIKEQMSRGTCQSFCSVITSIGSLK